MRVEATRPASWIYVDWWLTNHCTWHCSYCPELLRSGSITPPTLKYCLGFIENITNQFKDQHISIKFTGGEVTEWPGLVDLLKFSKERNIRLSIRTNANVDRQLWTEVITYLDDLEIVFHPEHTQTSVFLLNLDRAVQNNLNIVCVFNMLPQRFEELETVIEKIKTKYPNVYINRKMLFEDPVRNTQPMNYSEPQKEKIIRQHGDIRITQGDEVSYSDYPTMVSEGSNTFKGYTCNAGLEQFIVDAWGRVARGHCRQGGHLGSVNTQISWPTEPIKCNRDTCANAFDILATKIKI